MTDERGHTENYLIFAEEPLVDKGPVLSDRWKIMIVDDEESVHTVTRMVLDDVVFDGKGLEFISAFSGAEAKRIMAERHDIAVLLLDVVMETVDAGLSVVQYVRNELGNRFVRIILRTGQPGAAPPESVIVDYDINDYTEKTDLTAQRLFACIISSLRSYRDIIAIASVSRRLRQESIDRLQAEVAHRETQRQLQAIMDNSPAVIYAKDLQGRYLFINKEFGRLFHIEKEAAIGMVDADFLPPETAATLRESDLQMFAAGEAQENEVIVPLDDGLHTYFSIKYPLCDGDGVPYAACVIATDITERKNLEAQLRQAQKMEAVGRLAGGVAHDFNNMLGVIIGYTELALQQVDRGHPLTVSLGRIREAAGRSADLTRQLLGFARKQTICPKELDLNEIVAGMFGMLRPLLGEDIDLVWRPKAASCRISIDPTQVDQILANLSVNARDAIAGVGRITVETDNVSFDETYCTCHPGFIPGNFVMLAVSDDGHGMDKETLEKIFEPFFTTKGNDKGTGLGLATVYGIVKQNYGFINVYSEPGQGSTFKIYLPLLAAQPGAAATQNQDLPVLSGDETILVVEDDAILLEICELMLKSLGYRVMTAAAPDEALRLARTCPGEIDLFIIDVVMPGMNGRDLASTLSKQDPAIKLLFMSGYTTNAIAHHHVLDEGVHFIQKPFSILELASKVREVLAEPT